MFIQKLHTIYTHMFCWRTEEDHKNEFLIYHPADGRTILEHMESPTKTQPRDSSPSQSLVWVYEGDLSRNLPEGKGKQYTKDSYYSGSWKEGQKHGFGTEVTSSGCVYSGNWERNQKSGRCLITFPSVDAASYAGEVSEGRLHGFGIFKNRGLIYEGEFKHNAKEGEGTLLNPDGTLEYFGQWSRGLREGHGLRRYEDGSEYNGEFLKNK